MNQFPELEPARVDQSEEHDQAYGEELLDRKAHGITARKIDGRQDPAGRRNCREENPQEAGESDGDRCDGSGLDHQEESPAVKEAPERRKGLSQENVLSPGRWHHGRKLAIGEGSRDGQQASDQPDHQEPAGRADQAGDVGRHDVDARPDHGSGDDHGCVKQAEASDQVRRLTAGRVGRFRHVVFAQSSPFSLATRSCRAKDSNQGSCFTSTEIECCSASGRYHPLPARARREWSWSAAVSETKEARRQPSMPSPEMAPTEERPRLTE